MRASMDGDERARKTKKTDGNIEDEELLSTLGVTTANPADIERRVIAEIQQNGKDEEEICADVPQEGTTKDQAFQNNGVANGLLVQQKLCRQLAGLEQEIDAVAAGLMSFEAGELNREDDAANSIESRFPGETSEVEGNSQHVLRAGGRSLHHALVEDRLHSLKRKKQHLVKQLKLLEKDVPTASSSVEADGCNSAKSPLPKRVKTVQHKSNFGDQEKKEKKLSSLIDNDDLDSALDAASGFVETERERLIRRGLLTPFDKVAGFERRLQTSGPKHGFSIPGLSSSYRPTEDPSVAESVSKAVASMAAIAASRPTTKLVNSEDLPKLPPPTREFRRLRKALKITSEKVDNKSSKGTRISSMKKRRPLPDKRWRKQERHERNEGVNLDDLKDDSNEGNSESEETNDLSEGAAIEESKLKEEKDVDGECFETAVTLEGGLNIPTKIYHKLFDYQKTGVKWLWELHCQKAGGIVGDEMGLGKTIQVIAFLAALHHSGMYKPSIVVCPVTLARQWRREVKTWYPALNAEIVHDSAYTGTNKSLRSRKQEPNSDSGSDSGGMRESKEGVAGSKSADRWAPVIERLKESDSGLVITTYEQLRLLRDTILDHQWGYAILDEGHRIRNPDAETTLVCKQLQTVHRIIMTGAPIQNKLTELWSLFDFVFPGKLGVLPVFQAQFALPIAIGGYVNATPLQVSTAYRCAVVLRDLILPYLLRRMKTDVEAHLPKKTEHVLFCSLTEDQRSAYRAFLASSEVEQIFSGSRNSLYGIDILRKICNHPDLLERDHSGNHPDYGNFERSGKLQVVSQILKLWKKQGHRVLIFSQTQQMLDIIEQYIILQDYVYRRLDGSTPIGQRMALIDEFNHSEHVFVFILTTRVGGLGTNLVGANRVIIFDPDWNPSTDMQARERAWRIGQSRDVTVYRLITRGTIEEKIYHRQIYKHFLTNKILRDPQQRRFFKARDMRDLFVLQDDSAVDKTETSMLFSEMGSDIHLTGQTIQGGIALPDSSKVCSISDQAASTSKKRNKKSKNGTVATRLESKGKEKADLEEDRSQEDDARILQSLFGANGIHSAMDHDAILSINEVEKTKMDYEANKVAQRAMDALQQSRMMRASDNIAVPTWTGRSGEAGAPSNVRRRFGSTLNTHLVLSSSSAAEANQVNASSRQAGAAAGLAGSLGGKALSSSDLFARMRERRLGVTNAGINSFSGAAVSSSNGNAFGPLEGASSRKVHGQSHESFTVVQQLVSYFQQNGNSTSSSDVIEHFKDKVSPADVPKFKLLLQQIATLHKEEPPRWYLKPEYKGNSKV